MGTPEAGSCLGVSLEAGLYYCYIPIYNAPYEEGGGLWGPSPPPPGTESSTDLLYVEDEQKGMSWGHLAGATSGERPDTDTFSALYFALSGLTEEMSGTAPLLGRFPIFSRISSESMSPQAASLFPRKRRG